MTTENQDSKDEKIDLKHDSMEFAANHDGDDILDEDGEGYEEDAISGEELDVLEEDGQDDLASALTEVELDLEDDPDILPEEDWTDDLEDYDEKNDEEDKTENRR